MKRFIKALYSTLYIGVPIVVILIGVMYVTRDKEPLLQVTIPQDEMNENVETTEITPLSVELVPNSSTVLMFVGDVYFSEQYTEQYDESGISCLVDEEILFYMQNADLFMLNNEFSFSRRGTAMEDKQYTLRTDPKYISILQELGTDAVSIANNHILDYGQEAFDDTLNTLKEAEISYAGGGYDLQEALSPIVKTFNGQTFAIFAATRVSPSGSWYAGNNRAGVLQTYDAEALNKAIAEADSQYHHVIVFAHWGVEKMETPENYQRVLAKGYVDAGADLVIGCHPHVLQGFEYYKGVPIAYSLGNYLFWNRTGETVLLEAEFSAEGELNIHLIPCKRSDGVLKRIESPEKLFNHLTDLSYDAVVSHGGLLISQ